MPSTPRALLHNPVHFIAFGFGSGLAPFAPGTFGTLAAIPLYLLIAALPTWWYMAIGLLFFIVGVYACGATAKALGEHDHSSIVWDEVIGFIICMAFVPFSWYAVAGGFVLFRIFDIVKPWPIRWMDRHIHGGIGIVLDDMLAGVYAGIVLMIFGFLAAYFSSQVL